MKKALNVLLLVFVVLALVACSRGTTSSSTTATAATSGAGASTTVEGEGRDTVNIALTVDMGDMDPFAPPSSGRNNLRYSIYDYIAVFKEFGETWDKMDWQLAKDIRQIDDVTYEIEIFDYVKDAIGNPITAEDVVWCFETYMSSGNMPRLRNYIAEVKLIDQNTFRITLTTTKVGSLEYCFAQVGVVSRATYEANKATMSRTPITSGPYQIVECVSGSRYVLERNENYWQTDESLKCYTAKAQIERIIYNVIKEPAQVTISLQTGENDITTALAQSELTYFLQNNQPVAGYHVSGQAGGTAKTLHFNMDEGKSVVADNLALRQAILYSFDSQAIVDGAYRGRGEVLHDLATNLASDYNKEWDSEDYYNYNPERAKQLLEEAGYKDGIDPSTGKPLVIRLMSGSEYQDACVILQSYLYDIGLDCQLNIYDDALASSYVYDSSLFDMVFTAHGSEGFVTNVYDLMCGENKEGKATRFFVKDPELFRLLGLATNTATHSAETVEAIHDYVYEHAYGVGVLVNYDYVVSTDKIGIVRHPWGQLIGAACDYTNFI